VRGRVSAPPSSFRGGALVIALAAALSAAPALGQPGPLPRPSEPMGPEAADAKPADAKPADAKSADAKSADAKPADTAEPGGAAPPRDVELPPGHPPMGAPTGPTLAGQITREGFFRPAPDQVLVDKSLPTGTIAVQIIDADGKPVKNAPIALHILHSSVTKGESRERLEVVADEEGRHVFRDRQAGSGVSYQIKSQVGAASFATQPFALRDEGGVRAFLHVYEAASSIDQTAVVFEAVVLLDIKEDNIAINHLLAIHNFGKLALASDGLAMPLPADASAFQEQESMGEQSIVEREGGLALVGTFPPGTTQLTYRYQVPLRGKSSETLALPLPPRLVASRVVVGASESMALTVAGLPPAQKGRWHDGKRVLETSGRPVSELSATSTAPTTLHITISGIPTPGFGRWVAALLAFAAGAAGLFHLHHARRRRDLAPDQLEDLRDARERLLDEMALLERARASGDVGPRTYERLRLVLTDALARVIAQLGEDDDETALGPFRDAAPIAGKRRKKRRKKRVASAEA
jgi:hypothetical protein